MLSQHPAILWHFCGHFRMSRGALQKMLRRRRYEKRTEQIFCTRSEKWSENRSSRFEPKILLILFLRGSGPPLKDAPQKMQSLRAIKKVANLNLFCIPAFARAILFLHPCIRTSHTRWGKTDNSELQGLASSWDNSELLG